MMRLLLLVVVAAGLLAGPAAAGDQQRPPQNLAVAKATTDGQSEQRFRFQIASYGGDNGSPVDIAWAESNGCTGCSTSAVAVQVVFLTGNPSTIAPVNYGVAINQNCNSCTSYAYAYQYVVLTNGPVEGRGALEDQVQRLRQQMDAVAEDPTLSDSDRTAQLNDLTAQLKATVNDFLANAHVEHDDHQYRQVEQGN